MAQIGKLLSKEDEKEREDMRRMMEDGVASHFSGNMFKAFQYFDLDRSGRLGKKEIRRVLDLWNIPLDDRRLDLLLSKCDEDGDGEVSYDEFVDNFVRETVAPAAMRKRGQQSKEAMGVSAFDQLDLALGHGTKDKFAVPTVNKAEDAAYGYMARGNHVV